uniref:Uncharacterized protein n=1 Tax=Rhizophora mucronata TaxID=61149 RepID=A0A2P2N5V6_RHIMU
MQVYPSYSIHFHNFLELKAYVSSMFLASQQLTLQSTHKILAISTKDNMTKKKIQR